MSEHETALTPGQRAEFLGAATKALVLIADKLGPERALYWAGKGERMQELFLQELMMSIIQAHPFNPSEFLGKGWTVWKGPIDDDGLWGEEDIDPRSLTLSQVEITKFLFETCLKESEQSITGEEKLHRLKEKSDLIRFGGNVFLGLWLNYQANGENSALEDLYRSRGIKFFAFFGLVLRNPSGIRSVLYFHRDDGGRWYWGCHGLGRDRDAAYLLAGCAS